MAETSATDPAGVTTMLAGFAQQLRYHDITVGTGDLLTYTEAVAELDVGDLTDLYWAGRTTLVTRREQIPVYDRVFRHYFLHEPLDRDEPWRLAVRHRAVGQATVDVPATDSSGDTDDDRDVELGRLASPAQVVRQKSFEQCTPDELAALRRIIAGLRVTPPRRRVRRYEPLHHGRRHRRLDARRTVRAQLRAQLTAETADPLRWKRRRVRPRPLVLILDVSGSMSEHSRNLLQFAHAAGRAHARVEVFCFGTRLTRITAALRRRSTDTALARAAERVVDWEGGTQIGESLATYVRRWGRAGSARGAIVVIGSDGLDRGDPAVLDAALTRLARLAHRIVWVTPHRPVGAAPATLALAVAVDHIDALIPAADLADLEQLAHRLGSLA